ncbi:response regulator [Tenacibaculum geojense]|uniref:Response regulator n=1 Tax=Tenacibaculum geojense TaxID=915352 RepID=A0ABW3JQ12_9FLAO
MGKLNCILLVDDDRATNFFHKMVIEDLKVCNHVQICTDGRDALDYLTNQGDYSKNKNYPKPELIFLDINMPGLNGFDFLEEYKDLPSDLKDSKIIIMLSTSLIEDDRLRAESYKEVSEFKNKPLTEKYITDIIIKYFKT